MLDYACLILLSASASVIFSGIAVALTMEADVNVRVLIATLFYPQLYVTTLAVLVWRARFWRLASDVRLLFAMSLALTIALVVVLITFFDTGSNSDALWGLFAIGASIWACAVAFTIGNWFWRQLTFSRCARKKGCMKSYIPAWTAARSAEVL